MPVAAVDELFAYNAWANRRMFAVLHQLPTELYVRDLGSSHGGLHGTVRHIVWAEHLWLNRWLGKPNPAVPQGRDLTTLAQVEARWAEVEAERAAFLGALSARRLADSMTVHPSTGGAFVHTLHQMLCHVVDHSSYHRGQVVTLLRQLGVEPPATGLIVFYREHPEAST